MLSQTLQRRARQDKDHELQSQSLSMEVQGEGVELQQSELRQFGGSVEDEERFFSEATRKAVLSVRQRNAPKASGELEKQRGKLIASEVDALRPEPALPGRQGARVSGKEVRCLNTKLSQAMPPSV
jgi:hypothetical protein